MIYNDHRIGGADNPPRPPAQLFLGLMVMTIFSTISSSRAFSRSLSRSFISRFSIAATSFPCFCYYITTESVECQEVFRKKYKLFKKTTVTQGVTLTSKTVENTTPVTAFGTQRPQVRILSSRPKIKPLEMLYFQQLQRFLFCLYDGQ